MIRTISTKRHRERGSAMLIVFLFAAFLAISLYMEMPIVAFEAKRAKEQLLVDRAQEYAHAVKLYYRKFRAYPPSIDALENTNRMRFLRHRFKDPMTGEDKWRLLHAGPGGQLLDSKVNPIGLNANGQTAGNGMNGSSGGTSGFNSGTSTASASMLNGPGTQQGVPDSGSGAVAAGITIPQRPPEMPVNPGTGANPAANPDFPQPAMPQPLAPNQPPPPISPGLAPPMSTPLAPGVPVGVQPNPVQMAAQGQTANSATPMQGMQGLLTNPNPQGVQENAATGTPLTNASTSAGGIATNTSPAFPSNTTTTTGQSGMGVMQSGGIAGVASLAKGASIKLINEQKDYSLWEFYYDPTKDTSMVGQSGINPMNGASPANATGTNNLGTSNSTNNSSFNNASPATPATTQTPNPTSQQSPVQQP